MSDHPDSLIALVDLMQRSAPEYLDLFTATTDADFEKAFVGLLEKAVSDLETNKVNFKSLDEVGLSAALKMRLSIPGLFVTLETHSNGHVDLTIDVAYCVPMRKKLGEAKIYRGYGYHASGLEQLLDRYTTGREGRGLMIIYFKKENIKGLVQELRNRMDAELPCKQQGATTDHPLKWSFLSVHILKSGDDHEVAHIGCNLFTE